MTRSVSQTEQYLDKCAHAYYLRRVEGIPPSPAAWSMQGNAFHSAIETFEEGGRRLDAESTAELFSQDYSNRINHELNKEPNLDRWLTAGPDGGADIEARYVLGREQTKAYVLWAKDNGPDLWKASDGRQGIELHLQAEIGGVQVQGYIDQLPQEPDGSVRIRDLKTGSTKSKFQLQTYAILVRKALGLVVNKGDWYMAKRNGLSRPVDLSTVSEDEVGQKYADMDAGVKRGDFPANPGFGCRFCDVAHACTFKKR
ncbi:PD-(D/E)XK nuclease family protein [Streptomyces sp. NPDC051445]|uniref:PD-(D/E)XK nuclease family protein n=1 Tax=Streptomyces sp. NPDC051445 TaxID=3365653 RepID=UPI00379274BB